MYFQKDSYLNPPRIKLLLQIFLYTNLNQKKKNDLHNYYLKKTFTFLLILQNKINFLFPNVNLSNNFYALYYIMCILTNLELVKISDKLNYLLKMIFS